MASPEFSQSGFNQLALEAVNELKVASTYLQKPEVFWISLDEEHTYIYHAYPLHQDKEDTDIARLHAMPGYVYFDAFSAWLLIRGEMTDDRDTLRLHQYYLEAAMPVREATEDIDLSDDEDEEFDEIFEGIRLKAEKIDPQTLPLAGSDSAAKLIMALTYLKPHIDLFRQEFYERRDAMTRDEKLMERAQKYSWLIEPSIEKVKQVHWWVIGDRISPLVYAVRANSPDMAAAILDEHYEEISGFGLSMFDVGPLEDDYVDRFESDFTHPEVEFVRLIPYSRVPWPEDQDNLTPEQKVALEKFKN
jgi:hypothetical protein